VHQDLAGAKVNEAVGYEIGSVSGDVRIEGGNVVLNASEATALKLVESISTEVKAGAAAGIEGSKLPAGMTAANGKLDQLLEMMRDLEKSGQTASSVESGAVQISRVDLLLKKASLLKIEAEQMMLDQVERKKKRLNLATGQIDLSTAFDDFDSAAYDRKLQEANGLLEEARQLDPANTEVLLHLAEILTQLTEDDPTDEREVLYRVQALLRNPVDDAERFRLAQATFLLATSHEPFHRDSLQDAREMFNRLGRSDWVRHCDDLLGQGADHHAGTADSTQTAGSTSGAFNPVGNWNIQIMDAIGSTMTLQLAPTGMFQATQQAGSAGILLQAAGHWVFNPMNNLLQLQGNIGGFQPFMLGIFVQGQQGDAYYGVGSDGIAYLLSRGQ
jgi:hypothetical protein